MMDGLVVHEVAHAPLIGAIIRRARDMFHACAYINPRAYADTDNKRTCEA